MLEFIIGGIVVYLLMRKQSTGQVGPNILRDHSISNFDSHAKKFPNDECIKDCHRFPYFGSGEFGHTCSRCGLTCHIDDPNKGTVFYTNADGKRGTPKELLS